MENLKKIENELRKSHSPGSMVYMIGRDPQPNSIVQRSSSIENMYRLCKEHPDWEVVDVSISPFEGSVFKELSKPVFVLMKSWGFKMDIVKSFTGKSGEENVVVNVFRGDR